MDLRELALIGDRRTAALVHRNGDVLWYCPGRFDYPSVFGALLDPAAGAWRVKLPKAVPLSRRYREESAVLETRLRSPGGEWAFTDWMPMAEGAPGAICRRFTAAPLKAEIVLEPRPDFGRAAVSYRQQGQLVVINERLYLYASHPPRVDADGLHFEIPAGDAGWMMLADAPVAEPSQGLLDRWRRETMENWQRLAESSGYLGPYAHEVRDSLRALRLLTHRASGGVIAAASLGLPASVGADNHDQRHVRLRDAGMIAEALLAVGGDGGELRRLLEFLARLRENTGRLPLPAGASLDFAAPAPATALGWQGILDSHPVWLGDDCASRAQLTGMGSMLMAAAGAYGRAGRLEHYREAAEVADFVAEHWQQPDHGFWDDSEPGQYTVAKVAAAVGLERLAAFADRPGRAAGWKSAAGEIRQFVERECKTREGAYAAAAGSDSVDLTAALFPLWRYCQANSPAMRSTAAVITRELSADGLLYRRSPNSSTVDVACGFWMARYWILRGELEKARQLIDAGLRFTTDLGLLPEAAEPASGRLLGNLPQSAAHAALVSAVVDLRKALQARETMPPTIRSHRDEAPRTRW